MEEPRFDPAVFRANLLEQLAGLPRRDHLDALHAIDSGEIELDLTDVDTVRIDVAGRWSFEVPATRWRSF